MPLRHRRFVEELGEGANVRDYVAKADDEELLKAYNNAVDRFGNYRQTHLKVVHDYVFEMINKQKKAAQAQAQVSQKDEKERPKGLYKDDKNGTAGTDAKPFLEETIQETRATKFTSYTGQGKNRHQKVVIKVQGFRPALEDVLVAFITAMIGVYLTRIILSLSS